jgi:hypothetical protein
MSFIRSGSNPEGLYVWGDGTNINITADETHGKIRTIPQTIFEPLAKKYCRNSGEAITLSGASIQEIWVKNRKRNELKVRLSYKDWSIHMWEVTWEYIIRRYK